MLGPAKRLAKKVVRRSPTLDRKGREWRARWQGRNRSDKHRAIVSLPPESAAKGNVLISLINEPFLLPKGTPISHDHTHDWETWRMAQTWRALGYRVDVIRWSNRTFTPFKKYDVFIDARMNLERLAPLLNSDCVKVMHIDTAHWLFHTTAQHERLLALQQRRGVTVRPWKSVEPNHGIEACDVATMLGNDFTKSTYAFANKPIIRTRISTTDLFDWPKNKDWDAARRRFIWFGSAGMVHKGLDIVLEAFATMPDCHLTVCGPVDGEGDFVNAYREELSATANITTMGWTDIHSRRWIELAQESGAVVYPSCSEGGGGSVITCMHAGMLPIVTTEASVDIGEFGVAIETGSVDAVKEAVQRVIEMSPDEFEQRTRAAWEFARAFHTRDRFAEEYRAAAEEIVQEYVKHD